MGARLYSDLAWLWPIISDPREYAAEARRWRAALRERLGRGRHRVLELGCGGGHFTSQLAREFDVTAVDRSEKMLSQSKKLNPRVGHHLGDMRSVRLGAEFDAVVAYDAISYMLTERDLRRVFDTAAAHLRPGGVLLASPEWFRETFDGSWTRRYDTRRNGTSVTVLECSFDPDPGDTALDEMLTFIVRQGGRVRVETDLHSTGIFPVSAWLRLMRASGFRAGKERLGVPNGDPRQSWLIVGTKR